MVLFIVLTPTISVVNCTPFTVEIPLVVVSPVTFRAPILTVPENSPSVALLIEPNTSAVPLKDCPQISLEFANLGQLLTSHATLYWW